MMNKSAAYHEWLGIPLKTITPNHYEMLGIPLFETNATVISNGAARRVSYLQTMVVGEYSELAQDIQKEVSRAKMCLLREDSRTVYQNELMQLLASGDSEQKKQIVESSFSVEMDIRDQSVEDLLLVARDQNKKLARQLIWLIGSAPDCDLRINNQFVSRKHCLLFRRQDKYELEDWSSTNGTFVNDKQIRPRVRVPITTRDIVTLGKVTLMPWPPIVD